MSVFIDTNKNLYPLYVIDVKMAYPEWQEGDNLPDGVFSVFQTEMPELIDGVAIDEGYPQNIDGKWQRVWDIKVLSEKEIEERQEKNRNINSLRQQ
jgi:hypothetical protein